MIRLIPFLLIAVLVFGGVGYWRFFGTKQAEDVPVEAPRAETGSVNSVTVSSDSTLASKVSSLEAEVADLLSRIATLEKKPVSTTTIQKTTTNAKVPVYIPLGAGGSNSNTNWANMPGYEISLDPAEYNGYTSMQLEINMRLSSAGGDAMARLATSDGVAISSEVGSPKTVYNLNTTSGFKLLAGKKMYILQVKSSAGQEIFIQDARIKVNF